LRFMDTLLPLSERALFTHLSCGPVWS
jgi:hypothetical protein